MQAAYDVGRPVAGRQTARVHRLLLCLSATACSGSTPGDAGDAATLSASSGP